MIANLFALPSSGAPALNQWRLSTFWPPHDVISFDYSALMCDIYFGSDFPTKRQTQLLVQAPLSCSAAVCWKTVFAFMCTQMRNMMMIIPVIFFHPDWLSHSFSWWRPNIVGASLNAATHPFLRSKQRWNEMWTLSATDGVSLWVWNIKKKKPNWICGIELQYKTQNG